MRADRLLSILLLVQGYGQLSAARLAAKLQVSERTIYRDVDALSTAGVPIYMERGRRGGIRLVEGYRSELTGLTAPELEGLFAVNVDQATQDLGLGAPAAQARLKVLAALPEPRRTDTRRAMGRLHVDPSGWFAMQSRACLAPLTRATYDEHRVRIVYVRRDELEVRRTLEPLGLVLKAGEWYLVALAGRSGDKPRVYRVSRIRHVEVLEEQVARPAEFDLGRFWRESTRDFERSFTTFVVRLRVRSDGAAPLRQLLGDWVTDTLREALPDANGVKQLDVEFESVDQARAYLLGLADSVEVIAPAIVREALRAAAERARVLYAPSTERPARRRAEDLSRR